MTYSSVKLHSGCHCMLIQTIAIKIQAILFKRSITLDSCAFSCRHFRYVQIDTRMISIMIVAILEMIESCRSLIYSDIFFDTNHQSQLIVLTQQIRDYVCPNIKNIDISKTVITTMSDRSKNRPGMTCNYSLIIFKI